MFVLNCWNVKMPFVLNFQGRSYSIPYDNNWHELPDGACEPRGVFGFLKCARANPIPKPQILPQISEVDLNKFGIYDADKYEKENYYEQTQKNESNQIHLQINKDDTRRENQIESNTKDSKNNQTPPTTIPRNDARKETAETNKEIVIPAAVKSLIENRVSLEKKKKLRKKRRIKKEMKQSQTTLKKEELKVELISKEK